MLTYNLRCLLASPQGGVAASIKKFRVATETDAAGVVFLSLTFYRKTTPAARSSEASHYFFVARIHPPCGDCKEGTICRSIQVDFRPLLAPRCRGFPLRPSKVNNVMQYIRKSGDASQERFIPGGISG